MTNKNLEKLVWVLIYGGLLLLMLGLWSFRGGAAPGLVIAGIGGLAVLAGVALIWLRSRRGEDASPPTDKRVP